MQFLIDALGRDRKIDLTATGSKEPVDRYGANRISPGMGHLVTEDQIAFVQGLVAAL